MPLLNRRSDRRNDTLWALVGHNSTELVRMPPGATLITEGSQSLVIDVGLDTPTSKPLSVPVGLLTGVAAVNVVLPSGSAWFANLQLPTGLPRAAVAYRLAESMAARAYSSPDQLAIDYRDSPDDNGYRVVAVPRDLLSRAMGLLSSVPVPVERVIPAPEADQAERAELKGPVTDQFNLLPWRRRLAVRRGAKALAAAGLTTFMALIIIALALFTGPLPSIAHMTQEVIVIERTAAGRPAVVPLKATALEPLKTRLRQHWLAARTRALWSGQWADIGSLTDVGLMLSAIRWSPEQVVLSGSYSGGRVPSRIQSMLEKPWWAVPEIERSATGNAGVGSISANWRFSADPEGRDW